ncbi:MAG: phage portal protein [Flavobacteriales bacterium]|nr:phage portal protein [Flavobacteriales bacterium]
MYRGFTTIPQRVYKKEYRGLEIVNYGIQNAYPQEADYAISGCSIADSCCDVLSEFTRGNGFADESLNLTVVNSDGQTLFDILKMVSKDYSRFNGYALHFNYNLLGEIVSIHHVPFTYCRLGLPDPETLRSNTIRVWDNWANESIKQNNSQALIKTYCRYNPTSVLDEIKACGGIGKYNGQILYWTNENGFYPKSTIDSCFEQVLTLGQLSNFDYSFVKNGFSASSVFVNEEISPDDETYERNLLEMRNMTGTRQAGGVVYLEGKVRNLPVTINQMDKHYNTLKNSDKEDILERFRVPPVLVSRTRQGGFPNQDEIVNSFNYYNGVTQKYRDEVSRVFSKFMSYWRDDITSNFLIEPTTFYGNGRAIDTEI